MPIEKTTTEEAQAAFADYVAKQIKKGGCPQCGSIASADHPDGLVQCANCGNKFEWKEPVKEPMNG